MGLARLVIVGAAVGLAGLNVGCRRPADVEVAPPPGLATPLAHPPQEVPEPPLQIGPLRLATVPGDTLAVNGPAVLVFWAPWVPSAAADVARLRQFRRQADVPAILLVAPPDTASLPPLPPDLPVALATEALTAAVGGVWSLPTTLVLGVDGRLRARWAGVPDVETLAEASAAAGAAF